jgi:phage-related protein
MVTVGDADILWEGDSLDVISNFPDDVKSNLGFQLRLLQRGMEPLDYRYLGRGVYELRDEDERAWYRVVYLSRIEDVIYVLHCFEKKSRAIPKHDAETIDKRLKNVLARLKEEKKNAKRNR